MLDGGADSALLARPGSIPWKFADVDVLSTALINSFPEKALNIVMNQNFAGTAELMKGTRTRHHLVCICQWFRLM